MTNPFEEIGERQISGAVKAKERAKERVAANRAERERVIMVPTPLEKKLQDARAQLSLYRKWRRGVREEIIAAHREELTNLLRLLRRLDWARVEEVVDFVKGARWLLESDEDTRFVTLDLIDASIGRARIRNGRAGIDDGLPDEPLTPFIRLRRLLMRF